MASTITLSGDWMISLGNRRETSGTGNLGTYATNGIAVTPAQLGLGTIYSFVIDPAGGYIFEYVASTGKVKAYTPGGITAHTHDLFFNNAEVADGATTRVNIGSNLLGANTGADVTVTGVADTTGHGGIVQAGAVAAAVGSEVANSTNLSGVTFNWRAIGI